jgi:hypothetical protein
VGCEKREPTNTGSDGQKSFDSTEVKSQVEVETVKEPLVLEEQEVEPGVTASQRDLEPWTICAKRRTRTQRKWATT